MSIKQNFLFVVFMDPFVVGVLDFISQALYQKKKFDPPHLTIQGPFEEKVDLKKIASVKRKLKNDCLFIGNPGIFETKKGGALYMQVSSQHLESVWDKPDYPKSQFGFHPHITLYEGPDMLKIKRACDFLSKNRIELLCREFDVVQYVSKQGDMFPKNGALGDEHALSNLISLGKIDSAFRAKFMAALNAEIP